MVGWRHPSLTKKTVPLLSYVFAAGLGLEVVLCCWPHQGDVVAGEVAGRAAGGTHIGASGLIDTDMLITKDRRR